MTDFTSSGLRRYVAFGETDAGACSRSSWPRCLPRTAATDRMAGRPGTTASTASLPWPRRSCSGFEFRLLGHVDAHHDRASVPLRCPAGGFGPRAASRR
ncbi:hypothetical protein HBB16_17400 [Pseudonocardia sp. MCCB 268]|nr:hypothetical protein [Pseudonocardia cytotoxica]